MAYSENTGKRAGKNIGRLAAIALAGSVGFGSPTYALNQIDETIKGIFGSIPGLEDSTQYERPENPPIHIDNLKEIRYKVTGLGLKNPIEYSFADIYPKYEPTGRGNEFRGPTKGMGVSGSKSNKEDIFISGMNFNDDDVLTESETVSYVLHMLGRKDMNPEFFTKYQGKMELFYHGKKIESGIDLPKDARRGVGDIIQSYKNRQIPGDHTEYVREILEPFIEKVVESGGSSGGSSGSGASGPGGPSGGAGQGGGNGSGGAGR